MPESKISHLLLDFFGTIVDYSPSRTEQDYSRSYGLLREFGAVLTYDAFPGSRRRGLQRLRRPISNRSERILDARCR